jgi:hypothetical protein
MLFYFCKVPIKFGHVLKWIMLFVLNFLIQITILYFLKPSSIVWYMDHVVLEIQKQHAWKMGGAPRDTLEPLLNQQQWTKMDIPFTVVVTMGEHMWLGGVSSITKLITEMLYRIIHIFLDISIVI